MAITGIVGIIAGFISGKNAADQAKQAAETGKAPWRRLKKCRRPWIRSM